MYHNPYSIINIELYLNINSFIYKPRISREIISRIISFVPVEEKKTYEHWLMDILNVDLHPSHTKITNNHVLHTRITSLPMQIIFRWPSIPGRIVYI
jgi:hypothetical protein